MKELSIEEKAKRYDIALKKIKMLLGTGSSCSRKELEYVFPELVESEDERMMNQLHSWMKEFGGAEDYTEKVYQWLQGLIEKRGEQKDILEDSVLDSNKDGLIADTIRCKIEKQGEQKPAEWSEEDKEQLDFCCAAIEMSDFSNVDYRTQAVSWLNTLKERVQPRQEWSEEDEQYLEDTLDLLEGHRSKNTYGDVVEWLKSLRFQSTWKPSEENIKDLEWCADLVKDHIGARFHRLMVFIDELKKL